ncbi:MAG TPA: Holliday junction branch migration protein RuvA [Bacteroidales bacterium]|nr:Holliday junction branch migration protein RuvA [Bacteroidales bacterium]
MYEYIEGQIDEINPALLVIEANGVGFAVHISLNTFSSLNGKKQARVFTHLIVREDAHLLYGFSSRSERELFRNLLSVNGVGAATALMMLSSLSPDEIVSAISTENINLLKSVKGIGLKTAQRIIIDLKDKLSKVPATGQILIPSDNTIQNEALSALVMLGFSRKDAEKAVAGIVTGTPDAAVETVIKQALKRL